MMWWDPLFEAKKTAGWVRVWVDRGSHGQQKLGLNRGASGKGPLVI